MYLFSLNFDSSDFSYRIHSKRYLRNGATVYWTEIFRLREKHHKRRVPGLTALDVVDTETIAGTIVSQCKKYVLNVNKLLGQGYDA
ncbi:hypothetical protein DPMN_058738 [Dreissena polymorpha]|uniref:Uncharacterized protein n=1 Tax=Dreissena polymorpha TaxID=45954 RepID=A0A9D4C2A6_DREPO|nr:hypothetical protein DPMN_058738 [Dreissena polymorpha]